MLLVLAEILVPNVYSIAYADIDLSTYVHFSDWEAPDLPEHPIGPDEQPYPNYYAVHTSNV